MSSPALLGPPPPKQELRLHRRNQRRGGRNGTPPKESEPSPTHSLPPSRPPLPGILQWAPTWLGVWRRARGCPGEITVCSRAKPGESPLQPLEVTASRWGGGAGGGDVPWPRQGDPAPRLQLTPASDLRPHQRSGSRPEGPAGDINHGSRPPCEGRGQSLSAHQIFTKNLKGSQSRKAERALRD